MRMKFKKITLSNGVRVLAVPMSGNPTVTVMVHVGTGAYYEKPEQAGLSHFLEHSRRSEAGREVSARLTWRML